MPSSKPFACDAETHTGGATEDGKTTRKQVVYLGVFSFCFLVFTFLALSLFFFFFFFFILYFFLLLVSISSLFLLSSREIVIQNHGRVTQR